METLTIWELIYCALVLVLSYSIRGGTGFGGLNAPLLALVLPLKIIAPMITFLGLFSSYAVVARDFRYIVWSNVLMIMPYCLAGVLVGLYVFKTLDARTLATALGVVVVTYGGYSLLASYRTLSFLRLPIMMITAILGAIAGFVGTLFGAMAGIFFAIYLDVSKLRKSEFRATAAAMLLALGIARAAGYVAVGAITHDVLIACAAALPLMGIGIMLGNLIHANLNQVAFSRLVSLVFLLSGIPLIFR